MKKIGKKSQSLVIIILAGCCIYGYILFECLSHVYAQERSPLVIQGEIEEKVNFFGRINLYGEILNRGIKRYDFIYIEFQFFDRTNKLIANERTYVQGSVKVFTDSTISESSLEREEKGKFACLTSVQADSVGRYEYTIGYKEFDELPPGY